MNGEYQMPSNAGPAWRAACKHGHDMSLIEQSLSLTPEQRLEQHQRALDMILELKEAVAPYAAK